MRLRAAVERPRGGVIWRLSHRADPRARILADRHYNRQKIGTPQFAPPASCIVLYALEHGGEAFWITSWPFGEYVKHRWPEAWVCSAFRNENAGTASLMIREALAVTRHMYGEPPDIGCVTFIDSTKVKPTVRRGCRTWGRTYELAGFKPDGATKGGLLAFRILPDEMPPPRMPLVETYMEQVYRRAIGRRDGRAT